MEKWKRYLPLLLLIPVFFVGLAVFFYPVYSDWWNSKVRSRVVAGYNATVSSLSEKDHTDIFASAKDYNNRLKKLGSAKAFANPELIAGYEETLNITGTGIMGIVSIDKIDVKLPIYHGTEEAVLQIGAGHMEGSSLPVGGDGTHSVISAHTGLPGSLLFTHLDQMKEGDTFTITVLKEELTYQVDQILVVLPTEVENLYIEEGKDFCTLMTCTPYGINTHRLLVRGERIYPEEAGEMIEAVLEETETREQTLLEWAKWAALGIVVLLSVFMVSDILVRIIQHRKNGSSIDKN